MRKTNKQNPLPLASNLRNNQAEEQFWVSQTRPENKALITCDSERGDSVEVLY